MRYAAFFLLLIIGTASWAKPAAVAMPDAYSATTAKQVLQEGGNAVDAAVAAAFVLAVTYPEAGNLGGGGFMTLYMKPQPHKQISEASPSHLYFLDYREKAPLASTKDMYLDGKQEVIPHRSLVGYQASGVPGTVMGLWEVHQKFGSVPWRLLLQPAIRYAEKGFTVPESLERTARWYQKWVAGKSKVPLNFKTYFGHLKAGQTFKQPELAETLKRIAEQGPRDFYQGETAQRLVSEMQMNGGLISLKDLNEYKVRWREPIQADWEGYQVVSAPPPSSGGVAIIQLLKMYAMLKPEIERVWKSYEKQGIPRQAYDGHVYAELEKRVFADRARYLGDPDFYPVPTSQLIADDYLKSRIKHVNLHDISLSEKIQPGLIESPETTHFSIVDSNGFAVSNTYTLNMPFGSGVVIQGAGFLMNNEMDDFSTKPGVANVFGVIGGKANEIQPQKRMLSSMSPTLLMKNGQVEMVVGTPGGSSIITSVFQVLMNVYEKDMPLQASLDQPRVHHQLLPKDLIFYQPGLPEVVKTSLELMGYRLQENHYLGDVQAVKRSGKKWEAASESVGRGKSLVFDVP